MKFQQDIVDKDPDKDPLAKLEFNSAADQVNTKGVLLKMMLTILHENQMLKNNVSSDSVVQYRSCNLSFCSREESKYYCALELCLHVYNTEKLDALKGPQMDGATLQQLCYKIQQKSMLKSLN